MIVSLGTTIGLRTADAQLAGALRRAGLVVELTAPVETRPVRTLALTDLTQARAARLRALDALRRTTPRAVIYSTTTAALLGPVPGAVRFDALAQRTRPGRHGLWQRRAERRVLSRSPLLLPWAEGSLEGAEDATRAGRVLTVPVAIESGAAPAPDVAAQIDGLVGALEAGERPVAVTYAADPRKKGLDRLLEAWSQIRQGGEVLLVAGSDAGLAAGLPGVRNVGRLSREAFRALVRHVGLLATAPRREDYGIAQLEALAEGAFVVTTAAPGPYAALPLVRRLWPTFVAPEHAGAAEIGEALRRALDYRPDPGELARAAQAVAPWSTTAVDALVRTELVPALLGPATA